MRRRLATIASVCVIAAMGCARHPRRLGGAPRTGPGRPVASAPTVPREAPPSARLQAAVPEPPAPPPGARWNETHAGLEEAETQDCLGCHGEGMGKHSHPVEIDYAEAAGRAGGGAYRPLAEVRARGVALPGGKVGCRTCHSPASPWARFLAVPRELARARVPLEDYRDEQPSRKAREPATAPAEGAEVSHRPLCESCHVY